MKFNQFTSVLLLSISTRVLADFQLLCGPCCDEGGDFSDGCYPDAIISAENKLGCGNLDNPSGVATNSLLSGGFGGALGCPSATSFFSMGGLCGVGDLNFYQSGDTYIGYISGGDGSQVATCYPTSGDKSCDYGAATCDWQQTWYCDSYICS
ncbi:hypothetical protein CFAM422_009570 [Trichoderma lentiforme]|uniref:Uncharacterized protein n=1 Tax=Trichoderma lentiforme TaxID=1567552 RepID=A0A9P4X701_9HYPO|nr:hypothetical protein CFAM422_009570 [Trichoderma lentiforme]